MDRDSGSRPRTALVCGGSHHCPDHLVAQDHWRTQDRLPGSPVQPVVEIGTADSSVRDLDDCFVVTRLAVVNRLDPKVAGGIGDNAE
jgi:hypothetical protein